MLPGVIVNEAANVHYLKERREIGDIQARDFSDATLEELLMMTYKLGFSAGAHWGICKSGLKANTEE